MVKWTPAFLLLVGCLSGDNVIPEAEPNTPPQLEIIDCKVRMPLADGDVVAGDTLTIVSDSNFNLGTLTNILENSFVELDPQPQFDAVSKQFEITLDLDLDPGVYELEVIPFCGGVDPRTQTFFVD
jgi:hypothetical protein